MEDNLFSIKKNQLISIFSPKWKQLSNFISFINNIHCILMLSEHNLYSLIFIVPAIEDKINNLLKKLAQHRINFRCTKAFSVKIKPQAAAGSLTMRHSRRAQSQGAVKQLPSAVNGHEFWELRNSSRLWSCWHTENVSKGIALMRKLLKILN